jgi:copper chaperone CopZ
MLLLLFVFLKENRCNREEFTLIVPSIGCQGCMKEIVAKRQTLPGIDILHTDVPAKSLAVRYAREDISQEQIEQAVQEIGLLLKNPLRLEGRYSSVGDQERLVMQLSIRA